MSRPVTFASVYDSGEGRCDDDMLDGGTEY
jgi:hypothetical protein